METLWSRSQRAEVLLAIADTLASCVRRDLEPVAAQAHAAPAPGSFLARIVKVQYALSTFADTVGIDIGEQRCRAVRKRGKQVVGSPRIEPQFHCVPAAARLQPS